MAIRQIASRPVLVPSRGKKGLFFIKQSPSDEADIGFFAFLVVGDADRGDDNDANHDVDEIAGNADQVQAVFQNADQEYAISVPITEPLPPERLAPPNTAAASTSSSPPTSALGTTSLMRYACSMPPIAADAPR